MRNINENQMVRSNNKRIMLELVLITLLFCFSANTLAAPDLTKLIQSNYWYEDEDIRAVLKNRVGNRAYIAPALPLESKELIIDILVSSIMEAKVKGCALIPVNLNNSHWAALAIKADDSGRLKAIYNDSLGNSSISLATGLLLSGELAKIDPTIEWVDLEVTQQSDSSSCGAFTTENLITIAKLNISKMNVEELRNTLNYNIDASAIRQLHYQSLTGKHKKPLKCTFTSDFVANDECLV